MLVVGLTGGISSGKSTVTSWFLEKGIVVLDADEFGSSVIKENGELARDVLGSIIFHDESAKYKLNEMIHPLVKQKIVEGIEVARRNGEQLVVLDVPLLFESDFES